MREGIREEKEIKGAGGRERGGGKGEEREEGERE